MTESSPVITGIGLTSCAPNTDGVDMWSVSVNVIDPEDDVAGVGSTVTVLDGETELAVYDLACASGTCTGGWSAAWDGIDCTTGEASVFRFVVVDEFGHQSAPYDYTPV